MPVYRRLDDLDFDIADLPAVPRPERVLLTTPDYFTVEYVINPHMEGKAGTVDHAEARRQWQALQNAYAAQGIRPAVLEGAEGQPDMVFCANQTLPYHHPETGAGGVVLSRMHAPQRRDEVPHYERFFADEGYEAHRLPDDLGTSFEGMGDAIWHPERWLLWGGHGFRSGPAAYERISDLLGVPIILLHLADGDFYHLDTCFTVLDARSVLIYPGVFSEEARALIDWGFERVLEAPEDEARRLFACNAHCPNGQHVLLQRGCTVTCERLRRAGFTPVELDTGEFLKAGGSVFCMKQMFW